VGNEALSLGIKRPGREADHSSPSSAEVKECVELCLHSPYVFMAWCLAKRWSNFTLTFTFIICFRSRFATAFLSFIRILSR
jgi:hypothetical protein